METEQSPLKAINDSLSIQHIRCMSVDVRQMFCSISHPNNNGQEYFMSDSVRYINPVRCGMGLT